MGDGTHKKRHGHTGVGWKSPTYYSWTKMKERCLNSKHRYYDDYGGRGIKVCQRWRESFEAFLEDMGKRPYAKTLDRINVNANYSCGKCTECSENNWTFNCRWATGKQQRRNQRPPRKYPGSLDEIDAA